MSFDIFKSENIESMFFNTFKIKSYVFDDSYSLIEQIGQALEKVNENIMVVNNVGDALKLFEKYILEELSKYDQKIIDEATGIINRYITDGTIGKLINDTILHDINTNISNLQNSVNVIDSEIAVINYRKPSVNISLLPSNLIYNVGESINSIIIKFNASKGTNNLTKAEIYKNNILIETITNILEGENTFIDGNIINSDTEYSVKLYDNISFVNSSTLKINFVSNYYFGVVNINTNLDENLIKTLTSLKELNKNLTEQFNCLNQKIVFAYPNSYGDLILIMENSFNYMESFDKTIVTINNIEYNVYSSINLLSGDFKMKFINNIENSFNGNSINENIKVSPLMGIKLI